MVDWLAQPILHVIPAPDAVPRADVATADDPPEHEGAGAPAARVTVEILEDAITREDDRVVRVTTLRVVRAVPPSPPPALAAICAGHGTFRWKDFGSCHAVSQAISILRAKLKTAFGLADDPFHEFANGWKAKFFASSEA